MMDGSDKKAQKFAPKRSYTPYTALTLDEDYRVCTYGDAATMLFGFSEVSMLGKHVSDILPDFSHGKHADSGKQSSPPPQFKNVRMQARHADGNTFPVMVGLRQDYLHGTCRHLVLIRNLEERQ